MPARFDARGALILRRLQSIHVLENNPRLRSISGFSSFANAGLVSATKSGSLGGKVEMNSGSMVKLLLST